MRSAFQPSLRGLSIRPFCKHAKSPVDRASHFSIPCGSHGTRPSTRTTILAPVRGNQMALVRRKPSTATLSPARCVRAPRRSALFYFWIAFSNQRPLQTMPAEFFSVMRNFLRSRLNTHGRNPIPDSVASGSFWRPQIHGRHLRMFHNSRYLRLMV